MMRSVFWAVSGRGYYSWIDTLTYHGDSQKKTLPYSFVTDNRYFEHHSYPIKTWPGSSNEFHLFQEAHDF